MEGEQFNNPYIDELVGIPKKHRNEEGVINKTLLDYTEEMGSKKIEGLELEKTPRDIEILRFVDESVSDLMKKYGRARDITIPIDHIHLLSVGGTEKYTDGRLATASHASALASINIDRVSSDIQFCLIAFHEFLHLKSFKSLQWVQKEFEEKKDPIKDYRSGFAVTSRDGKEKYFSDIKEGLVGFFTQEFLDTTLKISPLFKDDLENNGNVELKVSRQTETQKLDKLIDDLWQENQDKFQNRGEIFDLFVNAQINGRLLKIGRLIEKTFGKGSFRITGEKEI